ncbi:MAG: DUF885 family protein, partial [Anaerolineales bacterium]
MEHFNNSRMDRRAFLKWLVSMGAGLAIAPLLEGCSPGKTGEPAAGLLSATSTLTPSLSSTPNDDFLVDLRGLKIDAFLDEAYKHWMLRDPEAITLNGLSVFFNVSNDKLTDLSDAYSRETQAMQAGILTLLDDFDTSTFSQEQELNAKLYRWFLQEQQEGYQFQYSDYQVYPLVNSLLWNMNYLFTEAQPISTEKDLADTLSRLGQIYKKMEQVVTGLHRRKENGVVLPSIIMPDAINDVRQYTSTGISHPYYTALSSKIISNPDLTNEQKDQWRSQISDAIKDSVSDGFQLVLDFFLETSPDAPEKIGVLRFPRGLEYYGHLLHHFTSTDLSAEAVHQLGLENVDRIKEEIKVEFSKIGYDTSQSINILIDKLGKNDGFISGTAAINYIQELMDQASGMLDQVFDFPLTQEIGVVGGTEGNYMSPAPRDGSRPPVFYTISAYPQARFRLKTIT